MSNGETIKQVRELLENPNNMTIRTGVVLTLTLLSEQHDIVNEDHKKTAQMWSAFLVGRWLVLAMMALILAEYVPRLITAFESLMMAAK